MTFSWVSQVVDKPFLLGFTVTLSFWFFGYCIHCGIEAFRRGAGGGKTKLDIGD